MRRRREREREEESTLFLAHVFFGNEEASLSIQRRLPMWQDALWTRGRYLLEKSDGGEGPEGPESLGDGCPGFQGEVCAEGEKPQDWLYESYYRMSQQHPLIVFLLLIVMGTCLALLAVFFASGLVRVCVHVSVSVCVNRLSMCVSWGKCFDRILEVW